MVYYQEVVDTNVGFKKQSLGDTYSGEQQTMVEILALNDYELDTSIDTIYVKQQAGNVGSFSA